MLDIEGNRGEQIQANWNTDGGGNNKDDGDPLMSAEGLLQQLLDKRDARQRNNVKAEVHHLNEQKKNSNVPLGRCRNIIGRREQCVSSVRILHRRARSCNRAERTNLILLRSLFDGTYKPISPLGNCLDKTRIRGRVPEHFAELIHNGVQTMIEVHERVGRPKLLPQILARHHFPRPLQQDNQNLKGLLLQPHPHSRLSKLAALGIRFEHPEPVNSPGLIGRHRRHHNRARNYAIRGWVSVVILCGLFNHTIKAEQLQARTLNAFDQYVGLSEQRMKAEEQSNSFLAVDELPNGVRQVLIERLKQGNVIVNRAGTFSDGHPVSVSGGLIHHWRGTVFIPGVTVTQTLAFLQDYDNQSKFYGPDVERSHLISRDGQHFIVSMRLRKKIAILDTDYDIRYRLLSSGRVLARSVSTRIVEIDNAGQKNEVAKPVGDDNGFMWRLNSYWRFEQRDGGTYVQLEAISLTRDIPVGLGWLISPFVSTIPKESLEFTLNRTRAGLLEMKK